MERKAEAQPPGIPTKYTALTPDEAAQRRADDAAWEVEKTKPAPVSLAEAVEALLREREGDPAPLQDILSRRASTSEVKL